MGPTPLTRPAGPLAVLLVALAFSAVCAQALQREHILVVSRRQLRSLTADNSQAPVDASLTRTSLSPQPAPDQTTDCRSDVWAGGGGRSTLDSSELLLPWTGQGQRSHKPLWPPSARDGAGLALATFALFIAAGGGIGGGSVLVPLLLIVFGFPAGLAVALSNITIVGGALANLALNVMRRHPFAARPLIDWDLIMVMEPPTVLGALLGGYLNQASPAWLTTCLLSVLVTAITHKLVARGVATWRKESALLAQLDAAATEQQPLLGHDGGDALDDGAESGQPHVLQPLPPPPLPSTTDDGFNVEQRLAQAEQAAGQQVSEHDDQTGAAATAGDISDDDDGSVGSGGGDGTVPLTRAALLKLEHQGMGLQCQPADDQHTAANTAPASALRSEPLHSAEPRLLAPAATPPRAASPQAAGLAPAASAPAAAVVPRTSHRHAHGRGRSFSPAGRWRIAASALRFTRASLVDSAGGERFEVDALADVFARQTWDGTPGSIDVWAYPMPGEGSLHVAHPPLPGEESPQPSSPRSVLGDEAGLPGSPHAHRSRLSRASGPEAHFAWAAHRARSSLARWTGVRGDDEQALQLQQGHDVQGQPAGQAHENGASLQRRGLEPQLSALSAQLDQLAQHAQQVERTPQHPEHENGSLEVPLLLEDDRDDSGRRRKQQASARNPELEQLLAAERVQLPAGKIGVLLLMFTGVVLLDLLKQRLTCGTALYWAAVASTIPFLLLVSVAVRDALLRRAAAKAAAGYALIDGDVHWTARSTVVYPAICSLAGLAAGMFGVGGGIVKGPLMLEMGVLPDVCAATSATMILLTAASASVVYISFGGILWDYAILLFVIGLLVTAAGQMATHLLMRALNRRSVIIFAMAAMMALSCGVMFWESFAATRHAVRSHQLLKLGRFCRPRH